MQCHRQVREVGDASPLLSAGETTPEVLGPVLEIFNSYLEVGLGSLLWVYLSEQGMDQMASRGP